MGSRLLKLIARFLAIFSVPFICRFRWPRRPPVTFPGRSLTRVVLRFQAAR
jgi:hypothetical protein